MFFETYIFEYFEVTIADSYSLGLMMCAFGLCVVVFYQRRTALYTNIF